MKLLSANKLQPTQKGAATPQKEAEPSKARQIAEQRLQGAQSQFPKEYDGVSYANIIEAWLQSKGIYGGVAQGNRNNMFYQLALELRYICDFKKEWLLQVMPSWDMPVAERESTIQSALNRPQGRSIPQPLLDAMQKVKSIDGIEELDEISVSNEMRNPLPGRLPYIFNLIKRRFPNNPHAMILCSLPPLGAICTSAAAEYIDGEQERPFFYCILTGPQAGGKKVVRRIDKLLAFPITEHDAAEREKQLEYKKEKERRKNEKKQPEAPELHIRKVPCNISKRVFLERSYLAGTKSLYSFGEELDSLTNGMKSGAWSNLSDILRLGFDGGEFGQDYAAENSFAAVTSARWCMLIAGTWGSVERFFPNLEDGTMTRFMFAQLEDSTGKPLLPKKKRNDDTLDQSIKEEVKRLYDIFSSTDDLITFDLSRTTEALLDWQSTQLRIFELGGRTDTALDTLRRRSMLMGFRSALVACATEKVQKDTVSIANLAVWVAQEVLDQQMALFSKGLNAVNRHEASVKEGVQQQLRSNSTLKILAKLPSPFSKEDLGQARKEMGLTGPVDTTLHRWRKRGLIEEVAVENKKMYQIINIKDS